MADPFTEDTKVWPMLLKLQACLVAELADAGRPVECDVAIVPGDAGELSSGKSSAWVRLVSAFPSSEFPSPDQFAPCASPLAAEVELAIFRCIKVSQQPLKPTELTEYTRGELADFRILRRVARCCDVERKAMGPFVPYGPEGGMYGGSLTVYLGEE